MLRRALLVGGACSSLLYVVAIDVIAALRYPDYHGYTSQAVSELMAVGAPTRTLLVWLFVPYNLLVLGLALGVWLCAGRGRAMRFAAASMALYGVVSTLGLFRFPMDVRGTVDSTRDPLHIAATAVQSVFIVAMIAFGAFARGRRFRRYSFATIAVLLVFGALASFFSRPLTEQQPTPWLGLTERVNIYATMAWIGAFAIALFRAQPDAGAGALPRSGGAGAPASLTPAPRA